MKMSSQSIREFKSWFSNHSTYNKRPGISRKLPKINPCFCVWTLFTLSCCYKHSGKHCIPKNTPKAEHFQELFSNLWWQLTTETVILCQNRILGDFAGLPVLTTHESFPDQLPVWAGGSCSSLPSSHPHCCRHTLSQGNQPETSEIPHADFHHTDVPLDASCSRKLLYLYHINAIQHHCGIQTCKY